MARRFSTPAEMMAELTFVRDSGQDFDLFTAQPRFTTLGQLSDYLGLTSEPPDGKIEP
jgi:hypothetical protein